MGLLKIKRDHIVSALDSSIPLRAFRIIGSSSDPEVIIRCCTYEAERLGIKITHKTSESLKWSKMTTTFYNQIRLGSGFHRKSPEAKAVTFMHELGHAFQWRTPSRRLFRRRYVFSARWRWILEMQCYRISIATMVRLGFPRDQTQRYIESRPDRLWKPYGFFPLNRKSYDDATLEVLNKRVRVFHPQRR